MPDKSDDLWKMKQMGRENTARTEVWRSQCALKASEAMKIFMQTRTYKALWALRARLNELLERPDHRKRFLWAGIHDGRVIATGTFEEVQKKAAAQEIKDPICWMVVDAFHPDPSVADLQFDVRIERDDDGAKP